MTKNTSGQKPRGWYMLYPKQLGRSLMGTIWQGIKGQGTAKQKVGRRGEPIVFFKPNTGRREKEFPRVKVGNLKYFALFEVGILIRVGVRIKKKTKKTIQDLKDQ